MVEGDETIERDAAHRDSLPEPDQRKDPLDQQEQGTMSAAAAAVPIGIGSPIQELHRDGAEATEAQAAEWTAGGTTPEEDALMKAVYELGVPYAAQTLGYDVACDIVQEVVIKLLNRRRADPTYLAEHLANPRTVGSFARVAVRNAVLNYRQMRQTRAERDALYLSDRTDSTHTWMEAAEEQAARELEAVIQRATDKLPPYCRAVFERMNEERAKKRDERGRYRVVAAELGLSVKTVQAHLVRAQKSVRQAIAKYKAGVDQGYRSQKVPHDIEARRAVVQDIRNIRGIRSARGRAGGQGEGGGGTVQ